MSSNPPNPARDNAHEWSLQVKGNVSPDLKRQCIQLMHVFILTPEKSYGAKISQHLKLIQVNVWDSPTKERKYSHSTDGGGEGRAVAETIFETIVVEEMSNATSTLHGGCAACMVDCCSSSAILTLGAAIGKLSEFAGLSQAMNIVWHQPARIGAKIRIVSTTMAANGKIKTARCEIWNGSILCISATLSMVQPGKGTILKEGRLVKL